MIEHILSYMQSRGSYYEQSYNLIRDAFQANTVSECGDKTTCLQIIHVLRKTNLNNTQRTALDNARLDLLYE